MKSKFRDKIEVVRVNITTVDDFEALGREWRAVEAEVPGHGFFQSWSWIGCLAEERYSAPVLLRAEAGGRTLGLALFNLRQGRLSLAESGDGELDAPFIEHNGPLATPEAAIALLRAAWDVAGARRLRLSGVHPASLAAAGGITLRVQERLAPFVDLGALRAAGAAHLAMCSANTRQQVRRSDRCYAARGGLRLECAADAAQALDYFEAMLPLHTRSWEARGKPGAFATAFLQRFHRRLIATAAPRGEVEMLRIAAGGGDVGYLYNFRHGGRVCAYQSGLDHAGAGRHGKPGLTSHALAIERALAAGDAIYDFLAGADRYKLSLATGTAPLLWAELVRPWSLAGIALRLWRR